LFDPGDVLQWFLEALCPSNVILLAFLFVLEWGSLFIPRQEGVFKHILLRDFLFAKN